MKTRRMLPTDIAQCLKYADIYPVLAERGLEAPLADFLTDLMLTDQHWGSVVEDSLSGELLCFGGCLFIHDKLAARLRTGEHPFLLADLCQRADLRSYILTFEEVEKQSRLRRLNFYGTLFTFARTSPLRFGPAMNHLQRSLVDSMSGFGIGTYFKHCYGREYVYRQFTSALMRFTFGAKLTVDYKGSEDQEVKRNHPLLFALTREEAAEKPTMLIHSLLCTGEPVLNLPRAARMLLRLELEGYSHEAVAQALIQGDQNSNWATALNAVRRNSQMAEFLGMNDEDAMFRDCVRDYVRQNPQELGVLPLLTPEEKNCWRNNRSLDSAATPNRKTRRERIGAA